MREPRYPLHLRVRDAKPNLQAALEKLAYHLGPIGAALGELVQAELLDMRAEIEARVRQDLDRRLAVSVKHAAQLLDLGETKVWELIHRGELPSVRIDKSVRIPYAAVAALLERGISES